MKISSLTFLLMTFIFGAISLRAQTKAVDNLHKAVYAGKLEGVKTIKTYNYSAANEGASSNLLNGKFHRMTVHEQDEDCRVLYDLTIIKSGNDLDTSYGYRYKYEITDGLITKQFMYPKWPNSKQYTLTIKSYTNLKQLASKETIVTYDSGDTKSYKKISYLYDKLNRVVQESDSSTNRCTAKFCDQIITKYYYDTLGVSCYIEKNKVRNPGSKMLLSKTFLTDSVGTTNRKYYYKGYGSADYDRSEYVEFDKKKNFIRRHDYQIKRDNWKEPATIDSVITYDYRETYNNLNQKSYSEHRLEKTYVNYIYNNKNQLIERSGKNIAVEYKESFIYDINGDLSEYVKIWNGHISRATYTDYNKFGRAETIKRYNDNGQVNTITKHEFIYW